MLHKSGIIFGIRVFAYSGFDAKYIGKIHAWSFGPNHTIYLLRVLFRDEREYPFSFQDMTLRSRINVRSVIRDLTNIQSDIIIIRIKCSCCVINEPKRCHRSLITRGNPTFVPKTYTIALMQKDLVYRRYGGPNRQDKNPQHSSSAGWEIWFFAFRSTSVNH